MPFVLAADGVLIIARSNDKNRVSKSSASKGINMIKEQSIVDDLLTLGGNVLGNLVNARQELKAQAKQQVEQMARSLDLVSREEFDAAFAMLAKARQVQEDLRERVAELEAKMKQASPKKAQKPSKSSLPIIKKSRSAKRRA